MAILKRFEKLGYSTTEKEVYKYGRITKESKIYYNDVCIGIATGVTKTTTDIMVRREIEKHIKG